MIAALKQVEADRKVEDVAREVGVSKHTLYAWKAKYGGMDVTHAQEAKQLRDENNRLRKLVADLSLDKEAPSGNDGQQCDCGSQNRSRQSIHVQRVATQINT